MNSIIFITISLVLINQINGHSYITTPTTRSNQAQSESGCRDTCGPCDGVQGSTTQVNAGTTQRGASIALTWPRNNHAGGFIRYSWAPSSQSNSQAAFDSMIGAYYCFEQPASTCHATGSDPLGGDTGAQNICGNTITVPNFVSDGAWTLQWIWFGGIYNLGEYRSCIDYTVSGGTTYSATVPTPPFYGGDVGNPNGGACKFANTNTEHTCSEPCYGPFPSGVPENGVPSHITASVSGGTPSATGAASGVVSGTPVATGVNSAVNSGVSSGGVVNMTIPCVSNDQCKSGICQSNGYCDVSSKGKLDGGGVTAIVFAMLFVVVAALTVVFVIVNKNEWSNWKPFNKVQTPVTSGGGFTTKNT